VLSAQMGLLNLLGKKEKSGRIRGSKFHMLASYDQDANVEAYSFLKKRSLRWRKINKYEQEKVET